MKNDKKRLAQYITPFIIVCGAFFLSQILYVAHISKDVLSISNVLSIQNKSNRKKYSQNPSPVLSRPAELKRVLPRTQTHGTEREVPLKNDEPFVYTSSAVFGKDKRGKKESIILFLYAQGTYVFDEKGKKVLELDITSCLIGDDVYEVVYEANGVYACILKRGLRLGERLSLITSTGIFRKEASKRHILQVRNYVKSMKVMKEGSRVLSSNSFWEGQMDARLRKREARYGICMMTQEKLFSEYLPEWIEYHRKIGVDHVYIYDNNEQPKLCKIFEHRDDVEVVHWPWRRSQIQAQNHFILHGRRRCQWAILTDVDEYIMINDTGMSDESNALKSYLRYLREQEDYSQVRLSSTNLGSSGYASRPRCPMAEAYWHIADLQDNLTKPVIWLGHALPDSHIHRVSLAKGYYTITNSNQYRTEAGLGIELIHMKFRSWHDYVRKAHGGRNSMAVKSWESFSWSWTAENPSRKHLANRNKKSFTLFRDSWRRLLSRRMMEGELVGYEERDRRYERVRKAGYSWKPRYSMEDSILTNSIIEREKALRPLRWWEI
ncbi:unnamed protein product [Agarophyton chilense]